MKSTPINPAKADRALRFIGNTSITAGTLGEYLFNDQKHARQAGLLLKGLVERGLVECDDTVEPRIYRLTLAGKATVKKSVPA